MAYVLGIDLCDGRVSVALSSADGYEWTPPELVTSLPLLLSIADNGSWLVGEYGSTPGHIAHDFLDRVGDSVPLLLDERPFTAEALTAFLAVWVTDAVAARQGAYPARLLVSHPGGWGAYRRNVLLNALWNAGLPDAGLIAEPLSIVEFHAAQSFVGQTVGVLTSDSVSVVQRRHPGGFELVACAEPGLVRLAKFSPDSVLSTGSAVADHLVEPVPPHAAALGAAVAARRSLMPPTAASRDLEVAPLNEYREFPAGDLPPRPPVRVTKLKLSRRRSAVRL